MLEFIRQLILIFNTDYYKGGEYWRQQHRQERINKDRMGEIY